LLLKLQLLCISYGFCLGLSQCSGWLFDISQKHHMVFCGSRQILLDLHPPQSAPAGTLQAISEGTSKGSFHQVLASSNISFGSRAFCLFKHSIQIVLSQMPLQASPH
jgi:hypothetical protein